jgi:hypothetical protein
MEAEIWLNPIPSPMIRIIFFGNLPVVMDFSGIPEIKKPLINNKILIRRNIMGTRYGD